jgi:tetratricopeptide (TPR) repeat protein
MRLTRLAVSLLAIAFCLFVIQASARFGFSRLLGRFALVMNSLPAANEAVRVAPSDPEAHRARARVLTRLKRTADASDALESATSLRYRDDYLWVELGTAKEEADDPQGALSAFDQAVRWAPYYAHTHWQRGNLLLRMGKRDEAFADMRLAASASRTYLPSLIDLAWGSSRGDVATTEQLIGIKDDRERLAFVWFLAKKGKGREAVDHFRHMELPPSANEEKELVRLLVAAKAFGSAFDIFFHTDGPGKSPRLFHGGFEEPVILNELVFGGWTINADQNKTKLAFDVSEKSQGERSLQITFNGGQDPATPLLSQLVMVYPERIYRVSFDVLTKGLATGGPPVITVTDATTDQLLGKSEGFPATDSWRTLNFEFTTQSMTEAVVIRLQRNNCDSAPCPIFGLVWLDEIDIAQQRR